MKNIAKQYIKWAVVLSVFTGMASCQSDYLETDPTTAASEEAAYSSASNLMAIVNGMHRDMYYRQNDNQGQNGQGGIMIMMDALADDLVFPSTGNGWYVSTVRWQDQVNENGANDFYPYQFYYALIRNANMVIANGPSVPAPTTADAATIKAAIGEAYAFRAFCYYMLVQIYGKRYVPNTNNTQLGVPIRLVANEVPLARNTVEEVYTQINKDLDEAAARLGNTRATKSHFNDKVILGLRARVSLTQGKYAAAITAAQSARSDFPLMNNSTYLSGFNNLSGNGEWMWGATILADQGDTFSNFGAYMSRNFNSTNIRQAPKAINSKLFLLFPSTDVRTKNFDPTGAHSNLGLPSTYSKFPYTGQKFLAASQADSRVDVPYMRSAEMYLIEAEALARSGNEAGSKAVFDVFAKNRNPSYTGATTTGTAYITEIIDSRRLEFWGEGFRFLDLKRLNQGLDRTGANHQSIVTNNVMTVANTDLRWEFLIPRAEINANPLIVQNPL
ncbi:RagB/SusD family nutrient uptake outer membrane protein [Chryseobacterium culicis]|uniref:RagB/SusD family nutrient uptake outer membrane protein n=1 Tax=Chryseobacterium culicis TaxID=680127 RepID=A0A2S9CIS4_CHRCI|nr:RagB/SusD family nutrient uptake outer membrane protein [Chryseobacterium culicis]PRB80417.1 RagB/SusD family nutrient uptake outer membrane protein [Chryseobacterium culicis]PRB87490.1 RagB/SusD family nutrient uptake outer membrane protein [Chryseobacterium culicis]